MTITRPTGPFVSTLPGRYYVDPAVFAREQAAIFGRMWICVGRAEAVAGAGSFRTVGLAGESVIVLRGRDGRLRGFYNVCRHRGARLCVEEHGQLKGALQCRYHAWTYGLDGGLTGAPNLADAPGFDPAAFGLLPVALTEWEGLIWLCLDDEPPPLAPELSERIVERFGETETFARYRVGDLTIGNAITYDVRANWKLIVENFMECYHCAIAHPEFSRVFPTFRAGVAYQADTPAEFADGIEAFTLSGRASRPPLPGLPAHDHRRYYGLVLRPNVFVNLLPDHVVVHTLLPLAVDRTRIVCDWLFTPAEVARSGFDPLDTVEFFDLVNRQDWEICELTQHGVGSRAFRDGGVFAPPEAHIRAFNDFILARLGDAPTDAAR
jgi:Rieske 2Fe-2S family protein